MAEESFALVDQLTDDFDLENELFDDEDDMTVFSAVSCFMRRDLNRIDGDFEVTVPTYEPREFRSHFRMTRGTSEILCREVMNTGRIPAGNTRGRATHSSYKTSASISVVDGKSRTFKTRH